jgi:hypothetical protein
LCGYAVACVFTHLVCSNARIAASSAHEEQHEPAFFSFENLARLRFSFALFFQISLPRCEMATEDNAPPPVPDTPDDAAPPAPPANALQNLNLNGKSWRI